MDFIIEAAQKAIKELYGTDVAPDAITLQETRKEFEGQVTLVTFPFTKLSKRSPEQTGNEIGAYLQNGLNEVTGFNVIKGFLNISLADSYWTGKLYNEILADDFAFFEPNGKKVMVEYSSPNTNKPLHLGHIRNNLLGFSVAEILAAAGYEVIKTNLVNDRGIHICKSMLAWQKFGNGETPESSGMKGDHLVGKYYVLFDKKQKEQLGEIFYEINQRQFSMFSEKQVAQISAFLEKIDTLRENTWNLYHAIPKQQISGLGSEFESLYESAIDGNINGKTILKHLDTRLTYLPVKEKNEKIKLAKECLANIIVSETKIEELEKELEEFLRNHTQMMLEAQEMLQKWEAGDAEVITLWKTMNSWVYGGFAETYKKLGVSFDKFYYESQTYLLGKDIIDEGLQKGVFFRKEDHSVWIDLTNDGLDQKLLLRSDGTSVYMTQDLGTAQLKQDDFHMDRSIYVVGNEQDYHFKVLFSILKKLGKKGADGLFHLSYGMVDLPSGKMKSREGTVVDADELVADMERTAKEQTDAAGKVDGFGEDEKLQLYHIIAMGALKYFLLKVDPKKRLLFDPNESVDFQGNTGPFIQYTHARIRSVLNRAATNHTAITDGYNLAPEEREVILTLTQFPEIIKQAADEYSPAVIANYVYELAKTYNKFYHEKSILQAEDEATRRFRLHLSAAAGKVINKGMKLLGIEVPERM